MASLFDWTGDEAYKQYLASVTAAQPGVGPQAAPASRRKKRRSQQTAAPQIAAPQQMTMNNAQTTMPGARPTGTANSSALANPATQPATTRAPSSGAANPATYGSAVSQGVLRAPAGSLASQVSGVGANPEALEMTAINPTLQADLMLGDQYGLPSGSRTAGMLATYLNPQDKAMALLGELPGSNVDWINFGEQLMGSSALAQNGAQLSPRAMVGNLVQMVVNETKSGMSGGTGSSTDTYNPIAEMARMNPAQGVEAFASAVRGALTGTMPSEQLEGYIQFIKRIGMQFATEYVQGNAGEMESQGRNWLTAMVEKLGPTLGL